MFDFFAILLSRTFRKEKNVMANTGAKISIIVGRIIGVIVVLLLAYAALWVYTNLDYLKYRGQKNFIESRYGITWRTNLLHSRDLARNNKRQIMVVYLNSGTNNDASNRLVKNIFPTNQFKSAATTYVAVLCDVRNGVNEPARVKTNQEEIVKAYDLADHYGTIVITDADGKEIRRIRYSSESAPELLTKISGGKFVALPAVKPPKMKMPFAGEADKAAKKAKKAVTGEGTINPPIKEDEE